MKTNKSVIVNSTVALWFRIARVFGMAPVSIRSDRDGYRVSACNYSALYGYAVGVVFTVSYMGYICNVIRVGMTTAIIDRCVWFWTVDFGLILAVVDPIIAGGAKLQSVMINDLIALHKINCQVNSCYIDKVKNSRRNTFITFSLIAIYLSLILLFSLDLSFLDTLQFKCFYGIVQFNFLLLVAAKLRLIILNVKIQNTLQIINEELLRLYNMIGSDMELTSQVFAWSLSRRLRVLCHSYWSTIDIYRRANKSNEFKTIIIYLIYAYRFTVNVYFIIIRLFTLDKQFMMTFAMLILFLIMFCTSQLVELIQITEPYQNIYDEVETTFTLLIRFKNRVQTLGRKVVKHLDIFIDLTLEKAYYSPFGLFTIKTSLVATTITAMTTCLAVVFQFQSKS